MKVFHGNRNGKVFALVAAANQKEAARLLRTSVGDIRDFYNVTTRPELIELAMSQPGVIFTQKVRGPNEPWVAQLPTETEKALQDARQGRTQKAKNAADLTKRLGI